MASVQDLARTAVLFVFFWVSNAYAAFVYFTWSLVLLPLRFLWPAAYWAAEVFIFKGLSSFVVLWLAPGQYGVVESGDDVREIQDSSVLLLANHQSTADVPMTMMALWPKGWCMGKVLWIMDQMFRYTHFGVVSCIRGDFFIKQGKAYRNQQGQLLADHLNKYYIPAGRRWVILYPEGGFLWKRRETSQAYGRKNGYPVLKYVTLPRMGALKVVLDTLAGPQRGQNDNLPNDDEPSQYPLKWILDITIGYKYGATDQPPDFLGMVMCRREHQDAHFHYRAYPISQIPRDEEGLQRWLYQRYEEKERLLEHFYQHGTFPVEQQQERVLRVLPSSTRIAYDYIAVALYHTFYLVSAYVFYKMLVQPWL